MAVEPQPATKLGVSAGALEKLDWRTKPERAARDEQVRVETAVRRVMDASDGTADRTQREELFQLYLRLVSDVQASIVKSVEKRRQSRIWGRALVAASSLAAALAGLGLALNYHGFGSRAFGIAAAVVGIWATVSTSLRLDEQYERNSRRNRVHKRLLRELQLYLVSTFPNVTADQAASRFMKFSREYENIQPEDDEAADGRGGPPS